MHLVSNDVSGPFREHKAFSTLKTNGYPDKDSLTLFLSLSEISIMNGSPGNTHT